MIQGLYLGNELVGYRFHSDLGVYDIQRDCVGNEPIIVESILQGSVSNGIFSVDGDSVPEISHSYILVDIVKKLSGMTGSNDYSLVMFDNLVSLVEDRSGGLNKRFFLDKLERFLFDKNSRLLELFGVRRTGKTVAMLQSIGILIDKGISVSEIAYISLQKGCSLGSLEIMGICSFLFKSGVRYLFIDEITYTKDNLDFTAKFSDVYVGKKVIMTGTDSAVFLLPNEGSLYNRVVKVNTSYIPYKEYCYLYSNVSIQEYIQRGALLLNDVDYEEQHYQTEYWGGYVQTSIIDNLLHSFERCNFRYKYRTLYELYQNSNEHVISTILYKWVQNYGVELTLRLLVREFKLHDVGSSFERLSSKYPYEVSGLAEAARVISNEFNLSHNILPTNISKGTEITIIQELKGFLSEIDCYYRVPGTNKEYVLPIAVRYGIVTDIINIIRDVFPQITKLVGISASVDEVIETLTRCAMGELLEEVIRIEMSKSGYEARKYTDGRAEVDIVSDKHLIEVKLSTSVLPQQMRWLVSKRIDSIRDFKSAILITTSRKEGCICISEKDVLTHLIEVAKDEFTVSRLKKGLSEASGVKHKVQCVCVESFLKDMNRYLGEV